ncbi:MAG TPA: diguanylate cyclase [Nitrospiraceae bacterium]|nr:MAG: diguanylate cyclase [Nitrospirae bacterium GWA2_46_11]OGW25566.1 MAG: diguanylate cyclase [Nitrospirae bacterium GWB2_47_37]HAK88558.1 diguanylate cyclase [Nitrospiraceae bacterium]HCZ11815.1 diguanylate cyclase [Nitrospiraceae bacterium]
MPIYIFKRLLLMIPLIFGITLITFTVIHLAPGGPVEVETEMSLKASAQARENLKKLYGLDKPLHVQYFDWLKRFVKLDFGISFVDGKKVFDKIKERIPVTLTINLLSLILIMAIAIPIGVLSATKQYSIFDKLTTVFVFLGFSTPTFWLALILMIIFGVSLGLLPISGIQSIDVSGMGFIDRLADWIKHLILPVGLSAFGGIAGLSRYSRSSMLEVIRQDYVRTARAKGLKESDVIIRHALRNALMPVVTILGLSVPGLIGGSVIFETIFAIPGMGQLFYASAMSRDYPTIMGILVIGAVLTLIGNLIADVSYALVDPRIRVRK